ncbi:MAG: flagellin [Negativicutes bacterium]|nr:flagellin [Negativicutes bacterium]
MIINTNMAALNTYRQLSMNEKATQSSLAKLSSGYRINSAADDAAGLSISEKMRGQISGLNQASSNAQDGISLVQTAEGALNETTSILQRMRELAVQAANGTNTTSDNAAMTDEFSQLKSEIDRIGNTTQFNTKNLLDGSLAGAAGVTVGQNSTTSAVVAQLMATPDTSAATMLATTGPNAAAFVAETVNIDGTNITVNWQNLSTTDQTAITAGFGATATATSSQAASALIVSTINSAIDASGANVAHVSGYVDAAGKFNIESGSKGISSSITTNSGATVLNEALLGQTNITTTATAVKGTTNFNSTTVPVSSSFFANVNGIQLNVTTSAAITSTTTTMASAALILQTGINTAITAYNAAAGAPNVGDPGHITAVTVNATTDGRLQVLSQSGPMSFSDTNGQTFSTSLGLDAAGSSSSANGGLTFQIGANAGQTLNFGIDDMRTAALGLSAVNIDSQAAASSAITAVDAATSQVSAERSKLGAIQNRLDHTINNLGTSSQNITAAEATIRDVDMAQEMTTFTKNNILQQAAQAMLSQANQQPQGVLQLLR